MRINIYTKSKELPPLAEGSLQHSRQMFCILEQNQSTRPYMLVAEENGKEAGHIIIIKRRGVRLLPPAFGYWYTIYGEGVYSKEYHSRREEIFAAFIDKLFDIFGFGHAYIEIRGLEDARFAYATLSRYNFVPIRDQRIYISLHSKAPHERLTRSYRAHIRKARERGATYNEASSAEEREAAIRLLHNYYRSKLRRPLPHSDIIRRIIGGDNDDKARMFVVKAQGKIIGCSICLYDGSRANLAYSCGLRKRHPFLYPGIMAVWAAIEDAHKRGYAHFEFLESRTLAGMRSGFKNFLLNFGGKQVGTLRWYHFRWNFFNNILRTIYV